MDELLQRIASIRVAQLRERRAPHKPLLLLLVLGRLSRGEPGELTFEAAKKELRPLLEQYAPPVQGQHQPAQPYWYLRSDGLWEIPGAEGLPTIVGGFPQMAALTPTRGRMPPADQERLMAEPMLLASAVQLLLEEHFPRSIHEELIAAVGLDLAREATEIDLNAGAVHERAPRSPDFRKQVLIAYEHRCAATGFRAALGGSYFGVEAAHVQWHAYGGPDKVANGLALNPLMHLLLDRGAWALTDDRRIVVSEEFTGSETAETSLRGLHGKALREPLTGHAPVSVEFIRWHRVAARGGVFRGRGLPLDQG